VHIPVLFIIKINAHYNHNMGGQVWILASDMQVVTTMNSAKARARENWLC